MQTKVVLVFILILLAGCNSTPDNNALPTRVSLETLVPISTKTPETTTQSSQNNELLPWTPEEGTLEPAQREQWFFVGQQGENISLRVLDNNQDMFVQLILPDGNLLQEGETILTQLPATGIYDVYVISKSQGGNYQIGLGYTDRQPPNLVNGSELPAVVGVPTPLPVTANLGEFITELTDGQSVSGAFSEVDETHLYTISSTVGQYISATLTNVSGEARSRITVFDPGGVPLATDGGSIGGNVAVNRNILAATEGLYTFVVQNTRNPGSYTLSVTLDETPVTVQPTTIATPSATFVAPALTPTLDVVSTNSQLQDHVPVISAIEQPSDIITHSFLATENQLVTIGLQPLEGTSLIPRIELIDPDGISIATIVGNQTQDRTAILQGFQITQTGPHTIIVTAEGQTSGGYKIAFGVGTTYESIFKGELPADRTVNDVIANSSQRAVWYTVLNAGDVISAVLETSTPGWNPVLELIRSDGRLIGIDNQGPLAQKLQINGITIPETGLYYFRIRADNLNASGEYSFAWRYVEIAPTNTPQPGYIPILQIEESVGQQTYAFLPFQGNANQKIRVEVRALTDGFDPVAALLDSNANILIEADDGTNGELNPSFEFTLPTSGTYNLRINDYNQQSGRFLATIIAIIE